MKKAKHPAITPLPATFAPLLDRNLKRLFARSACKGQGWLFDLGHSDEPADYATKRHKAAARLCTRCPARTACKKVADTLEPEEREGVWAGLVYDGDNRYPPGCKTMPKEELGND